MYDHFLQESEKQTVQKLSLIHILVQCCEYNDHADYPYVSIDDARAAELATEYLLSNGGSKIALINGPGNFKYARRRQEGFMNALRNAEVMIPKQWIVQLPEVSYEMAYAAVCRLLNSDSRPNAFFTISDVFAAAVIRAAKRFHLHVPLSLIHISPKSCSHQFSQLHVSRDGAHIVLRKSSMRARLSVRHISM